MKVRDDAGRFSKASIGASFLVKKGRKMSEKVCECAAKTNRKVWDESDNGFERKRLDFLRDDPIAILRELERRYTFIIPVRVETPQDMQLAGELLGRITNAYSYLAEVDAKLAVYVKAAKQNCVVKPKGKDETLEKIQEYQSLKENYEMMVLRKNAVSRFVEILKQQYNCISRMITVKIEINKEIKMSEHR